MAAVAGPCQHRTPCAVWLAGWLVFTGIAAAQQPATNALSQFDQLLLQARYGEAETYAERQLRHFEQNSPGDRGSLFRWNWRLGRARLELGQYQDAEPVLIKALEQATALWPAGHVYTTEQMVTLADLYTEQGRFAAAEKLYTDALARRRRGLKVDSREQAANMQRAIQALEAQGQSQLAADLRRVEATVRENPQQTTQVNTAEVAHALDRLANLYTEQGRYSAAEPLLKEALELREHVWGPLQADVAASIDNLARLSLLSGNYTAAENDFRRALDIRIKIHPAGSREIARARVRLAEFYLEIDRLDAAAGQLGAAIRTYETGSWQSHPEYGDCLLATARLHETRGDYARAEVLNRRGIEVLQKVFSSAHKSLATAQAALAAMYRRHGRADLARRFLEQAIAIREQVYGAGHPALADSLEQLAQLARESGALAEARDLYERVRADRTQALGESHPHLARTLTALASTQMALGELEAAAANLVRAESLQRQMLGDEHGDLAATLALRARLEWQAGRLPDARPLSDEAVRIATAAAVAPGMLADYLQLQAQIVHASGDVPRAITLLTAAIEQAEEQRATALGSDFERGAIFARSADAFELLAEWHAGLNQLDELFALSEQSRARTLLEQMQERGGDLLKKLPESQRTELEKLYLARQTRAASLQRQVAVLLESPTALDAARRKQLTSLQTKLAEARQKVAESFRDIATAATAGGVRSEAEFVPATLAEFTQWVQARKSAAVCYIPAAQALLCLVIPPAGEPRLIPLAVDADVAGRLMVTAGPLSSAVLNRALELEGRPVFAWLASPTPTAALATRLADLAAMLLPAPVRTLIAEGTAARMYVIAGGPLVRLPLETLVLEAAPETRYLLDVGPPLAYAPSATVLMQLAGGREDRQPPRSLLTLGDPLYGSATATPQIVLAASAVRAEEGYLERGGALSPLPFSGAESRRFAASFREQGLEAVGFTGAQASELAVRRDGPGRQVLHLACHGFVDRESGNLFGALALASNASAAGDPANDGFLTLAELYDLDLSACEIAILSACQTNIGPQQAGEGAWALSRGFLVAGARRVVASNWLVSDEAAGTLIGEFGERIAAASAAGELPDYARSLHAARQLVRNRPEWSAPFYWAPFILLGPE